MLVPNDMNILAHIWNLKFEINDNVISSHTCFQVTLNVGDFLLSTSRIWLYLGHYFFSLAWRIPCQGEHLRRRLLINQKQTKKGSSSFHHFCSVKQLNSRMPTTQPDSWLGNSFFKHVLFIASRFCVVSSLHSFSSMNKTYSTPTRSHLFFLFFHEWLGQNLNFALSIMPTGISVLDCWILHSVFLKNLSGRLSIFYVSDPRKIFLGIGHPWLQIKGRMSSWHSLFLPN